MLQLVLKAPPSANEMYICCGKHKRTLSKKYRAWREDQLGAFLDQRLVRFTDKVTIIIYVPKNRRRDVDNYVKPILDLFVKAGILADDRIVDSVMVTRFPGITKCVEASIEGTTESWKGPLPPRASPRLARIVRRNTAPLRRR